MEPAPPALTPEHIDSLFALMAEAGAVGVRKVQARLLAAETDEAVERMSRSLQTVGRYLRQTLALKLRFDREQAQVAVEQRHAAEQQRQDAERVHADARGRHRKRVRDHFARLLWTEYEADDAQEIFNDLDDRLGDLAEDAAFLGTPIETLIARLTEEFVVAPAEDPEDEDPEDDDPQDDDPQDEAPQTAAAPVPHAQEMDEPPPDRPVETHPPPPPEPAPPEPAPPDPWPEPYIPPWERLRPGQMFPGGSGW